MAYNVSQDYRDVVYSGEALYDCVLYINQQQVPTEQIGYIKISSPIIDTSSNTGKIFHIGTFISQELEIKFKNLDGLTLTNNPLIELSIGLMVNGNYEYVPIGKYLIDELGENYQKTCKINCLDYAIKFNSNIDISQFFDSNNRIAASDLFTAICNYYGVTAGTIPNVNNNKYIYVYDSTLTGKQYIMMLAELFGGNAKIDRTGACNIIPLKNYTNIEIDTLKSKSLELGDTYYLSRVCYDNGSLKLQAPASANVITVSTLPSTNIDVNSYYYLTTDNKYYKYISNEWTETTDIKNTLYLMSKNFFITQQSEIDNIYNAVKDFSITDIKCDNRIDLSIDCWDIVKFTIGEEEYYSFYDNTVKFNGTTMGTVKTKVPLKSREETTNIIGYNEDTKIRKIQTEVDEQNQTIATTVSLVDGQNAKISVVEQKVNEINQKISDIADITTSQETLTGSLTFTGINTSEPINVTIYPISENISYLYPYNLIYPANDLYIKLRTLRFTNTSSTNYQQTTDTFFRANKQYYRYDSENDEYILLVEGTNYDVGDTYADWTVYNPLPTIHSVAVENTFTHEIFDYELPDDLLFYDSTHYDKLVLDYDTQTVYVNKQCTFNFTTGQVELLSTPRTDTYTFPSIPLTDGDYTVEVLKYDDTPYLCYLFVRLMSQNIYTTQFYTKVETNSLVQQTSTSIINQVTANYTTKGETQQIQASLDMKVNTTELISTIEASADVITLHAGRLVIDSGNFQLTPSGNIVCTGGTIGGFTIDQYTLKGGTGNSQVGLCSLSGQGDYAIWAGSSTSTNAPFRVGHTGELYCSNANISGTISATSGTIGGFGIGNDQITASKGNYTVTIANISNSADDFLIVRTGTEGNYNFPFYVRGNGFMHATNCEISGNITASTLNGNTITGGTVSGTTMSNSSYTASGVSFSPSTSRISGFTTYSNQMVVTNSYGTMGLGVAYAQTGNTTNNLFIESSNGDNWVTIQSTGGYTNGVWRQGSLEKYKKNFEKLDNKKALEIVLNTDIYKYNLKTENDKTKKHLGFIIGEKYNYADEIVAEDEKGEAFGVDTYTMTSASYGAIQELYKEIQELKEKVG